MRAKMVDEIDIQLILDEIAVYTDKPFYVVVHNETTRQVPVVGANGESFRTVPNRWYGCVGIKAYDERGRLHTAVTSVEHHTTTTSLIRYLVAAARWIVRENNLLTAKEMSSVKPQPTTQPTKAPSGIHAQ